jgi:uncharacterized protein YkwD
MKKYILGFGLLLGVLWGTQAQGQAFSGCATGNENPAVTNAEFEQEVLRLVNVERKKKRLSPLSLDENLTRAARYHAQDMAEDDYFDHNSQDRKNGKLVKVCGTFDRARKFAPSFGYRAENISAGDVSPKDVMNSWMRSPGHKANILNKNYTHIGIGYYKGKKGYKYYWAQTFGGK